jgi:hypothetical protein
MSYTPEFLTSRLLIEGKKVVSFFNGLSHEQWKITVYSEEPLWTIEHFLVHFIVSETSLLQLVENIVNGGYGVADEFNLDSYNKRKVSSYKLRTSEEMINQFWVNRKQTANFVSHINQISLHKKGRHPFLGLVSLDKIIKLIYRHNQLHLREIRDLL